MAKIDDLRAELVKVKARLVEAERTLAIEIARGGFDTGKTQLIAGLKARVIELEREIKIESATIVSVSASTNQLIKDILEHRILAPSWFVNNNINWVITGHISEQEFLTGYYNLIDQGIIQLPPEPEPPALLSANIKISFTNLNIGGFSSSIPINDIGELQALSNSAPEWKYTLIGSSTNQPVLTLSELINMINDLLPGVEPPIPPITPTEVKWIPEPFFGFINEVFRR